MYRDFGSKPGSAGVLSSSKSNIEKKERLRKLALENIDLSGDPYFMRNHIGSYECRLCLTLHNNEGNYLAHTQGKRHQINLQRRQKKLEKHGNNTSSQQSTILQTTKPQIQKPIKIGRPGYNVAKIIDSQTGQKCLFFQIMYPDINNDVQPTYRFMSTYEQKIDLPFDKNFQFLLFAAEPYDTIAFKIPNLPIDKEKDKFETNWDKEKRVFHLKLHFLDQETQNIPAPPKEK